MSTVQQLISELTNIISQTARKNTELRQPAENTLEILKSHTSAIEEKYFLQSLAANADFINPFIVACSTRNAKYSSSAIQCIHLLINSNAVAISSLENVVQALSEATHLGVEIQLKILQILPSLLQNYGEYLHGKLLADFLQLCSILQGGTKTSVVVNAAAATLQQLVISIFDRVSAEDETTVKGEDKTAVAVDNEQTVHIGPSANDALKVLIDLCNLTEKLSPKFLHFSHLSESFGLELLESILSNQKGMFIKHVELGFVLRTRVVPLLLRAFSEKRAFSITVRVTRLLYLLIRRELPSLKVEGEVILSLLTHMLQPQSAPVWKRTLCMEVFQGIMGDMDLVMEIFEEYDTQESRRPIIKELLSELRKLVQDSSKAIGSSDYSVPFQAPQESQTTDDNGVPITITNAIPLDIPGISVTTSSLRVPCIDLLDKSDPPHIPTSYIPYLILSCVNLFGEGLARSVAASSNNVSSGKPTKQSHKKKLQKLPPKSKDSELFCSLISDCWEPLSGTFELFFLATLDTELYQSLVRAAYRMAHTSGILSQNESRNEFLSLLGTFSIRTAGEKGKSRASSTRSSSGLLSMEGIVETIGSTLNQRKSDDGSSDKANSQMRRATGTLTSRNILCIRALLNAAVALGNFLGPTWSQIYYTLAIFYTLADQTGASHDITEFPALGKLRGEFSTVDFPVRRLLDYTSELEESAFYDCSKSLCSVAAASLHFDDAELPFKPDESASTVPDSLFLMRMIGEICVINFTRFTQGPEESKSWILISKFLLKITGNKIQNSRMRTIAADTLNTAVILMTVEYAVLQKSDDKNTVATAEERQCTVLGALLDEISNVSSLDSNISNVDVEIHISAIECLKSSLEQCGSRLQKSWTVVFDVINTSTSTLDVLRQKSYDPSKLLKTGFESLQLICNDFLDSVPSKCLNRVIECLYNFCQQTQQLNISFTSISIFQNVSDHLMRRSDIKKDMTEVVIDESKLKTLCSSDRSSDQSWSLWLIILLRLAAISKDFRAQVRNGALHTLLQIFESYGTQLPGNVWRIVHAIVLPSITAIPQSLSKENIETTSIILEGISTLYASFLNIFTETLENFEDLWQELVNYWTSLIELRNPFISKSVYSAFSNILQTIDSGKQRPLPEKSMDVAWRFWVSQTVPKAVQDAKAEQESLTALVNGFTPLYNIDKRPISDENLTKSFVLLEACGTFEILPPFYSDRERPSPLQQAALEKITKIGLSTLLSTSLLFETCSRMSVLSLKKPVPALESEGKSPSFVCLSYQSLQLIQKSMSALDKPDELSYLIQKSSLKLMLESIVRVLETKFSNLLVVNTEKQMWQVSTEILLNATDRLTKFYEHEGSLEEMSELILRGGRGILSSYGLEDLPADTESPYASYDIEQFTRFITIIEPSEHRRLFPEKFWSTLSHSMFLSSLLYEKRQKLTISSLSKADPTKEIERLTKGTLYGSTSDIVVLPRKQLAYHCFSELFRLADIEDEKISSLFLEQLLWRSVLVLSLYIADQPLRGKAPASACQREELDFTLNRLLNHLKKGSKQRHQVSRLSSLLVRMLQVSYENRRVLVSVENLLLEMEKDK